MAGHTFKVGQTVILMPARQDGDVPSGTYVVQRLLPIEGAQIPYRVRNAHDGHERVVMQDRLSATVGWGTGVP